MQTITRIQKWFQLNIWSSIIWRPVFILVVGWIFGGLCVSFGLPFLGEVIPSLPIFDPVAQITTPQTKITVNTLPLNEASYWSTRGRLVEHLLITNENTVILKVLGGQGTIAGIVVINAEKETFYWKATSNTRSVDADSERVYVGGINIVQAFDLRTGEKIWEYKQPLKSRGSLYVKSERSVIKVYDHDVFKSPFVTAIFFLDAQTGELLSTEEVPNPFPYPSKYRTSFNTCCKYTIQSDGRIVATDIQTGQKIGYLEMSNPSIYDKIAASDEFLAVYNNNNRELIIFTREN